MRMIEELFYGNICPCEKHLTRGRKYSHLLDLAVKNEEKLLKDVVDAINKIDSNYDLYSEAAQKFYGGANLDALLSKLYEEMKSFC